ncbi:MAG: DUF6089 family protein [Saprospiraceae bacterium]
MKNSLLLFFAVLFLSFNLQAQRGWEAGGWIGVSHYFGDINSNFNLKSPGLAAGVNGRYNFNNRLCVKLSANYGSVSADDSQSNNSFEQNRNLHFNSVIFDGTSQFEFNFLPYDHGSSTNFYTPYLFAGLSVFYFNPKAELDGETYELRDLGTEGQFRGEEYFSVQGALAYGVGLKFDLSYEWSLNIELSARRLFTDYLDDVSTVYPDLDDLESLRGEESVALSNRTLNDIGNLEGRQRGDSNNNDNYAFFGISLMYYFGDLRCPTYGSRR